MEATLQIFIKALNNFLKQTEYKEYKVSDRQFVYLLANKSVVSVLIRKDLGKNHIIVEEIFDTDAEKSELEYFCKKYYTEWVTFFRFDGTIMQQRAFKGVPQFETILKKIPELELEKRYNEWPGIKTEFIVYKLEESNKKGYALIKAQMFEKVINPDDIETRLIEYIIESIDKESFTKEGYLIHNGFIDIIFDKEFVEIIQNRYLNQIKDSEKNIRYQIPDLIKYTIEDYTKEKNSIDIFNKVHNKKFIRQEMTQGKPVYKPEIQHILPKFKDRNKEYCYVLVEYLDNPEKPLYYISEDFEIKVGDIVLVGFAGYERLGRIVSVEKYDILDVPYPITKTRKVISKIEDFAQLKEYGVPIPEEFLEDIEDDDIEEFEEDMEELSEHINQTKEAYHVIKVTTKTKQSADEITTDLYKKHLIASSKLTITESTYIWRNTPIIEERYKLEMISRGDKLSQLKYVLEELNDRKNSKIFGAEMNNIPNYMKEQINQYLDVKSNGEK